MMEDAKEKQASTSGFILGFVSGVVLGVVLNALTIFGYIYLNG